MPGAVRIGVLAEQGGFASHLEHIASVGAIGSEVRSPGNLEGLDGLILPGGESTTISMALERDGLAEGIRISCAPLVNEHFALRPCGLIDRLALRRRIYGPC